MANGYFDTGDYQELTRLTLARAEAVNAIFDAIINGFDKLPTEAELKEDRVTYAVLAGGPVNYTVNLPYDPASYTAGLTVKGKVNVTNTGAATLNVYDRNGVLLGAVAIKRLDGSDLEAGDMPADAVVPLIYNGTEFRLTGAPQGIIATAQSYATAAAASAAAAQMAKNNAETAEANAEAAYDSFRGVYYGALASDPLTDPLGNPIDEGDWYYNTTTDRARIYTGAMWSDIGVASLNQYKFTASGGETQVSGQDDNGNTLSYNPDFVWVFKNGVRLIGGEDYTASNGTSITFTVALSGSDEIMIDAFSPFTITNALDKHQNLADLPDKAMARSNLGVQPTDSPAFTTDVTLDGYSLLTSFAADAGTTPDLDSITTPGTYGITVGVNAPGSGIGILHVYGRSGSSVRMQVFYELSSPPNVYFRRGNSVAWTAWQRVITDGVANQTITGPLTIQGNDLDPGLTIKATGTSGDIDAIMRLDGADTGEILYELRKAGTLVGRLGFNNGAGPLRLENSIDGSSLLLASDGITVNGTALPFQKIYESPQQTITSGGSLNLAHGLGVAPRLIRLLLVCTTADAGYSVGNIYDLSASSSNGSDNSTGRGVSVIYNATNITIRYGSAASAIGIPHRTTGDYTSITNTSWRLVVQAYA